MQLRATLLFTNSCEMDTKVKIKEEELLSNDIASQNKGTFFTNAVTVNTNSEAALLDNYCDVAIKTEIKSEPPFQDFCTDEERECIAKHYVQQNRTGIAIGKYNCDLYMKTEAEEQTKVSDFGSQNEVILPDCPAVKDKEFTGSKNESILPDYPAMKNKEFNTYLEMDDKIEVKVEPWWLEKEPSSVCEDIKDDCSLVTSSSFRSCRALSGGSSFISPIHSAEVSGSNTDFYNGNESCGYESKQSGVTEMPTVEQHIHPEQSDKCNDVDKEYRTLYPNQRNLMHKGERRHKCTVCEKKFTRLSHLKRHNLIHEGKKPYQCKTCDKNFTQLSSLKMHNLIHEGKKLHKCKVCDKSFTRLSHLKLHNLIHEGNKPFQCTICNKRFNQLIYLKRHYLVHEGKKPHQCKICDKSFTQLSYLKRHNVIHEGKKPFQCKTCDKSFTKLSNLKVHTMIHEGKKPHQCKTCDKSFTQLSHLKRHNMFHEGDRPHHCKTCDKRFTQLSHLKRHNLTHQCQKVM